jgi:hypothetical protein
LKDGIVEPSVSPYNSPLLLVPKKGGARRVVVDFRQVNKRMMADKFPLPRIDEILDNLQALDNHGGQATTQSFHRHAHHQTVTAATSVSIVITLNVIWKCRKRLWASISQFS